MQKYVSQITRSQRLASDLYTRFSDLRVLAALLPPDEFQPIELTPDLCTFQSKKLGETGIRVVDRAENSMLKFADINGRPFAFFLWFQFKEVASYDTRIRITLHLEVPSILKFAIKGRIQKGIDQLAEAIAKA